VTRVVRKRLDASLAVWEIADRIAKDDPKAADEFVHAVDASFEFLARFPESGDVVRTRKQRVRGARLWQVKGFRNYVILYRATDVEVEILTVFQGARNLAWILRGL
jgi:toxin ParE1/3/4